jgi:hypothetical protein
MHHRRLVRLFASIFGAALLLGTFGVASSAADPEDDSGKIVCTGALTNNGTTCTITQTSTTGSNNAVCELFSAAPTVTLTCNITQVSAGGDNRAKVRLRAHQKKSPTENATETATVSQKTTGAGSNFLDIDENVKQQIEPHVGRVQNQTARQFAGFRFGAPLYQKTDTGQNLINLDQDQKQHAESNVVAIQHQTSRTEGHITQISAGISRAFAHQRESQRLQAKPGSTQRQDPDDYCCAVQQSNPADTFDITEEARQLANLTTAFQTDRLIGSCTSSGRCQVNLSLTTNSGTQTQSCFSQGSSCSRAIFVGDFGGEGTGRIL